MTTPYFYSVGFVLIDDIVFPDGQTFMAELGGGSTHASMGMRIWDDTVGLLASVGDDFPKPLEEALGRAFDLSGLQKNDTATTRAWQLYEHDGKRTEVFRTDINDMWRAVPRPDEFPSAYANARGVHLLCQAPDPLESWIPHLRRNGCDLLLWEPVESYCLPENRKKIQQFFQSVDVVSLSLPEARRLTELEDPHQIIEQLLADGADIVALRMGARGSLVASAGGEIHEIPIYPVEKITDVTGAGNAYCGGLVVGLAITGDMVQAGLYGAVSASLVVENLGALIHLDGLRAEAERRLEYLNAL